MKNKKKIRIGIVLKSVVLLFLLTTLVLITFFYVSYNINKKKLINIKKQELNYLLGNVIKKTELIILNINTIVNDLTITFDLTDPNSQQITSLLKQYSNKPHIYGVGYAELPRASRPSFAKYIHENGSVIDINEVMPDYTNFNWFKKTRKTLKKLIQPPEPDQFTGEDMLVSYYFPYINNRNKFEGVFIVDVELIWLKKLLNRGIPNGTHVNVFFQDSITSGDTFVDEAENVVFLNEKYTDYLINTIKSTNKIVTFEKWFKHNLYIGNGAKIFEGAACVIASLNQSILLGMLRSQLYYFLSCLFAVFIFLYFLFFIVLKISLKPIVEMSYNVRKIAKGDFSSIVPVKTGTIEVIRLNVAVRKMQIQLKHYVQKMKITAEMNAEMKIAGDIQMSAIPKPITSIPTFSNVDLFQYLKPAKEASGDFYDYYMIDDENLFLSIGDVTGKGVPAALFTVMMLSMEKMFIEIPISMSDTLKLVNRKIIPMNEMNIFISYFCMVVNLKTGKARYANAGHDSPFIINKDGTVIQLKQGTGTFLGIFENVEYSEEYYQFEAGDTIFMYTDGITEAMNKKREMFGKERTVKTLAANCNETAENMVTSVINDIYKFVEDTPQSDDICAVSLKFN
jgi:sigma-B regulation protein RsbU (phosphoserine phosphatase)